MNLRKVINENFGLQLFLRFVTSILIISATFTATFYFYQKNIIHMRLIHDGTVYVQLLANTSHMAIFTEDKALFDAATIGYRDLADLQSASLYTADGRLIFSSGPYPRAAGTTVHTETRKGKNLTSFNVESKNTIAFYCPIFSQKTNTVEDLYFETPKGQGLILEGWAEVSLDKKNIASQLHTLLIVALLAGFFIPLIGTAITFPLLSNRAIKPLRKLVSGIDAVRSGTAAILPVESQDDIGRLTEAFNRLVNDLQTTSTQLQQTQKMEAIGLLAGGIAHDFNNLLNAMLGHIDQLKFKTAINSPSLTNIEKLEICANQASALTKNLLMYSRMKPLKTEVVDLNDIIRGIQVLLESVVGETVQVNMKLTDEPLPIMGDKNMIEQSIINLGMNAKDAMPLGGILTISTNAIQLDRLKIGNDEFLLRGRFALLMLEDTGRGMTKEIRERIFDPFFTTKDIEKGGTGLGLNIVYGVVKKHKGFIDVASSPGEGTSFKIYIPLTENTISRIPFIKSDTFSGGSETILFVEDNTAAREVLSDGIRYAGYTVIEAATGMDAIEKFQDKIDKIDLIICDVVMPKITGLDVYHKIRSLKPHIHFLFVSGYVRDELTMDVLNSAETDFLAKPYNTSTILKKIREMLDRDK